MVEIKLSPLDQKDLLELLEYALKKKLEEKPITGRHKWDDSGWYKLRVYQLKKIIKGYRPYSSIYQSSLGGLVKDIDEGLEDETYY